MPCNQLHSQTSDPAGDNLERGDERLASARRVRDDGDDDDRTVEEAGAGREGDRDNVHLHLHLHLHPRPSETRRDDDEDDEDDDALTEPDVMAVLDRDDLKRMEGPDA